MKDRQKEPPRCKQCGFTAGFCTCKRCQSIRARQFCSDGCEQGYNEIRNYEIKRAMIENAVNN